MTTKEDWEAQKKVYYDRLEEELGIIEQMGFAAYFLIVYDFINWAKEEDIPRAWSWLRSRLPGALQPEDHRH